MQLADLTDAEILAVVNPLMDNLMQGSNDIDYDAHVRDFTYRLRRLVSPEGLERMCSDFQSRFGHFTERDVVGLFRREDSVAVVWRQRTSASNDEFVADVVIVEQDGQYRVDHTLVY